VDAGTALTRHRAAVARYAAAARQVAERPELWRTPAAEGKWSPAQVTLHLVLAFEAVRRELVEGVPMALRTTGWQRLVLRHTIVRRLLRGGPFPRGARAPREARPPVPQEDAMTLIGRFEALGAELEAQLMDLHRADPRRTLTHPYFGGLRVPETIYISARHIEHHTGQLPVAAGSA
jgi:hypothetical protein